MNYVKKIESNIAGGVDYEIGAKTLVIGNSAGGKTMIIRAIELALAGGTSDLEGRAWVGDDPRLLALAPAETPGSVWSRVTLSEGETAEFSKLSGKHAVHHDDAVDAAVLALRGVRASLGGSADKARVFVLEAACASVTEADVLMRLPTGLHATYKASLSGIIGGNATDKLQKVQAAAAKRSRDLRKESKGAQAVIDALGAGGPAPTEAQVEAATELARQYQTRIHSERMAISMAAQRAALMQSMADHQKAIEHWLAEVAKIPEANADDIVMQAQWQRATSVRAVVEAQLAGGGADCGICGARHDTPTLHARLIEILGVIDTTLGGFSARTDALELRGKMEAKVQNLTTAIHGLKARWESLPAVAAVAVDLHALEAEGAVAEARRQELLAAFDGAANISRARALAHDAHEKADRFKRLADACKSTIAELVAANLQSFTARVNKYMPKGMEFGTTTSGARFQVGLKTTTPGADGYSESVLHTALSGAEWVAVTTAIGCAVTEKSKLAVLLPEERAYDPEMLSRLMRGLAKAPAQIVLTSTVKQHGKAPPGWTVIDLRP